MNRSELIRIAAELLTNQLSDIDRPTKLEVTAQRRKQCQWAMDLKRIADAMNESFNDHDWCSDAACKTCSREREKTWQATVGKTYRLPDKQP